MSNNILEVHNLSKSFATQKAVDDISFNVERGSIFGLLGPNGAGKTTLIRMITGIFYPDSGRIIFENKNFDPLNDPNRIGYMPEERGLYKKMKIGEQAIYLCRLKGMSKKEAIQTLKYWFEKLNMETWWNKKVEDLSKGMSQKLQFVVSVMHNPSLIILDEPFSGLDPVNANLLKDEIFELAQKGASIIFSTHRMEQVEEICSQIILINKGQKILDGKVHEIKQQFKENLFEVKANIDANAAMTYIFEIIEKKKDSVVLKLNDGTTPNEVLQFLINRNVSINGFNEKLPTINDIFINLVGDTPTARQFIS